GESLRTLACDTCLLFQAKGLAARLAPLTRCGCGAGSSRAGPSFSQAALNSLIQSFFFFSSARASRSAWRLRTFSMARSHAGAGAIALGSPHGGCAHGGCAVAGWGVGGAGGAQGACAATCATGASG